MNVQPIDALMAEYVSGSLPVPAKILVDAHLEIEPESHRWLKNLETAAGYALDAGRSEPLHNRDAMLSAIFGSNGGQGAMEPPRPSLSEGTDEWMPSSLKRFVGFGSRDIPWRFKLPGVRVFQMNDVDGCEVTFLRIKPGYAVPTHTHEGRELTLVLKGSFRDGDDHYARGDVAVADDDVDHKPVAGLGEDCICFVINDAPLRFTGPIARLISSILPRSS